jgi:hypothetical protein
VATSLRTYLFEDGGAIKRIPKRVCEGLVHGRDALPEYANTVQRVADVLVENIGGKAVQILRATGSYWHFDENGKIQMGLVEAAGQALEIAYDNSSPHGKVVSIDRSVKRRQFHDKHRWDLTMEQLDWIAGDMWPKDFNDAPKISVAEGKQPKPVPLTFEAEQALSKARDALFTVRMALDHLSEQASKSLAFAARHERCERSDAAFWDGIAKMADRNREIAARHRTGKGVWYAIVELLRWDINSRGGEVTQTFETRCEGRKAAVLAVRQMLSEKASQFSEQVTVEASVKCDLEWPYENENADDGGE